MLSSAGNPKPIYNNHLTYARVDADRIVKTPPGYIAGSHHLLASPEPDAGFVMTYPLFHLAGFQYCLVPLLYNATVFLPAPSSPPTARMAAELLRTVSVHALAVPPAIFDELVKNYQAELINPSSKLKVVMNAGGPMSPSTGKFLRSRFLLTHVIGQTETAQLCHLVHNDESEKYIMWNPLVGGVVMEPIDENDKELCELTIHRRPQDPEWAQVCFQTHPHLDVWRTRDLFKKHPTKDMWAFECRKDDTIVLNNGEKINPVGMEQHIQGSHPLVGGAVMFGLRRDQVGLLLEVSEPYPTIGDVWPCIEEANKMGPRHGRIYRHMIIMTSHDKPLRRAGKGTIQRAATYKDYEQEINALYQKAENSRKQAAKVGAPRLKISQESIQEFVRQCVLRQLNDDQDLETGTFYDIGMDSLQTIELTRDLQSGLTMYMPEQALQAITADFVYDHPTLKSLSEAVFYLVYPSEQPSGYNLSRTEAGVKQEICQFIDEFTHDWPKASNSADDNMLDSNGSHAGHTVLLTGSTGFLGHYLLRAMANSPSVRKIYCLNRSNSAQAKFAGELPAESSQVDFSKIDFFNAPNADISRLPNDQRRKLSYEVDHILHNAWQVDFALSLAAFRSQLTSFRNLLDFTIQSPRNPHFVLVSSVGTVMNLKPTSLKASAKIIEDMSPPPPIGYLRSKAVGEVILARAAVYFKNQAHSNPLKLSIVRTGQIAGTSSPSVRGPSWKKTDWVPRVLKTAKSIGSIPAQIGGCINIDWVPVDACANTLLEILIATPMPVGDVKVYNLVNPHSTSFTTLLSTICDQLSLPPPAKSAIPYEEWIEKLSNVSKGQVPTSETLELYPALQFTKLLEAFAHEVRSGGSVSYDIESTLEISKSLGDGVSITEDMMRRSMDEWKL